ncbi:hypothetical protein D8674_032908 [Pyrus ussuriensis x Pyrus communis]|uniref:Uncharacterized protein n=1 Tax=Pyrus ussuriensis x Pyrus communis TaxID=2448454 RepID=A0A5N5HN85_9ROSA|nr:hypothetical protein D8674_032908 [Pyrus ussuriensis x Pyrus communis]
MAKIAFVLIFTLVLLMSIQAVLGDDDFVETAKDHINTAATAAKDAADSVSKSDAFKEAKETASTLGGWFTDKFHDMGFGSDDDDDDDDDHDSSSKAPKSG